MGILERASAPNEVHVIENFYTEEELALLDAWVESSMGSAEQVVTSLSAKTYNIITNRESVRHLFVRLREFMKNKYNTDTLHINQLKVLEVSPWMHEVIADPDYVPTEEELATSQRPTKMVSYNDEMYWTEGHTSWKQPEDKFAYANLNLDDASVLFKLFKDDNGIDLAVPQQCHAIVIMSHPFTGGSVKINDSELNVSAGDVIFFKKQVSEEFKVSEILTGQFKSIQLLLSEDRLFKL